MIDLKPYRAKLFPEIKDFSDPMDHLRYGKKLSPAEILWFRPSFYKDVTNWFLILTSWSWIGLLMYSIISGSAAKTTITILISIVMVRFTLKTIKYNRISGDINLYDLLIRDLPPTGDKVKGRNDID